MQQVSRKIERGSLCAEQSIGNDRDIRLLLRRAAQLCRSRSLDYQSQGGPCLRHFDRIGAALTRDQKIWRLKPVYCADDAVIAAQTYERYVGQNSRIAIFPLKRHIA